MTAASTPTSPTTTPRATSPVRRHSAPVPVLRKRPLPAGRPREWYEAHNRQLKAMRLAVALLDSGIHTPVQARNRAIRSAAARLGEHPPSNTTCRLVRSLLP